MINPNDDKETLSNMSRFLMLRGSFTSNLGLMNGKMGIVIFFYHYAKYTRNSLYRRFAGEMLNEIYQEMTNAYPYNFSDGLCGIAWAMVYLIRNDFVSTDDEKDLLGDLDAKVMEWDARRLNDASLETGILGLGHYILSRFNAKEKRFYLPQDYLRDYFEVAQQNNINEINQIISEMERGQLTHKEYLNNFFLYRSLGRGITSSQNHERGILVNGIAGKGLNIMLGKDCTIERRENKN